MRRRSREVADATERLADPATYADPPSFATSSRGTTPPWTGSPTLEAEELRLAAELEAADGDAAPVRARS